MLLKVCGLNNIANINQLLPLQPGMIGFIFHAASKRYAGGNPALAAFAKTITGVKKVGVFVAATEDLIAEQTAAFALDAVQLHGGQRPAFCESLRRNIPVIKVFSVADDFDIATTKDFNDVCDYFLFDTATQLHGGSGQRFDWDVLRCAAIEKPFLLSGGIAHNVTEALRFTHPAFAGIDVNSRYETSPGIKNTDLIKDLIHEIHS